MGNKRVILGKAKTTSGGSDIYGLWVSKPGVDVINTSNNVLADPEDMLFDSRRKEIISNPLASGSGTVTFSDTTSASNYLNTDSGFVNYGTTYDYVPVLVYCFVDSSTNIVYPMYYEIAWSQNVTTGEAGEPVISTSSGYIFQSHADIYKDKFKIYAKRWWNSDGSLSGFSAGSHTFHWAIFPVGEAT